VRKNRRYWEHVAKRRLFALTGLSVIFGSFLTIACLLAPSFVEAVFDPRSTPVNHTLMVIGLTFFALFALLELGPTMARWWRSYAQAEERFRSLPPDDPYTPKERSFQDEPDKGSEESDFDDE